MKPLLTLLIIILCHVGLLAQTPYSAANPVIKTGALSIDDNALSNFLSVYPVAYDFQTKLRINRSINFLFQELASAKISGKKRSKQIPIIRKVVESAFLTNYVPGVDFEQLIRKGYYNDITATALYALVFDHLDIPYSIKLEKHQVYPIIDPEGAKIAISIPNILLPTVSKSEAFAKQYIELLEDMKMLKKGESTMNSQESLFQRYYFSEEQYIDMEQLSSVIYFRIALGHYQKGEYHLALAKLDLAQQVLPMPRHQPFRLACLFQLAAQFDPGKPETFEDLFKLYDNHPVPLVEDEILALFIGVSENQLFTHRQVDQFEQSYALFLKKAKENSALEQKVHTVYLFQKAKFYAGTLEYDKVFVFADSLFRNHPQDENVQEILAGLFKGDFQHGRDFEKGLDQIYAYRKKYPYLLQHKGVQDLELFYCAERIRFYFENDNVISGDYYLTEFENLLAKYGHTSKINYWIKTAYIAASDYYLRIDEFQKARQITHNAAQLVPNDPYFQHRVELLSYYP